jgi:hypothetical protein
MRVAASILMLITTAFVTLRLLEPETRKNASMAPRPQLVRPAVTRYRTAPAADAARAAEAPAEEVRLDIQQEAAAPATSTPPPGRMMASEPALEVPAPQVADRRDDDRQFADDFEKKDAAATGAVAGFAEDSVTSSEGVREERQVAKTLNRAAQPVPATAGLAAPAAPSMAQPRVNAPTSMVTEAYAYELPLAQKSEVFGISVDPNVFRSHPDVAREGARPDEESVNVEALVNYFAGPPTRPRQRRASRSRGVARAGRSRRRSRRPALHRRHAARSRRSRELDPPIARDARVDVDFNGQAVASFHRIGDDDPIESESVLLYNVSVTGLYDSSCARASERSASRRCAALSLRHRRQAALHQHVIHGRDLAGDWKHASRRHRLASLGASGRSRSSGSHKAIDVARRAEELVTQNPKDPLARELAHAANARPARRETVATSSCRRRTSAPTRSGR